MNKVGYLITSTIKPKTYFTASSAYDKPNWVGLTEATKYVTADIAESAMKKLIKNGVYAVRLVSVQEAMEFEFPDEQPQTPIDSVDAPIDGQDNEMVAQNQDDVCQTCTHEPCTCDVGDQDELSDDVPPAAGEDDFAEFDDVDPRDDDRYRPNFDDDPNRDHDDLLSGIDGVENEEKSKLPVGQLVTYKGNNFTVVGVSGNVARVSPVSDPSKQLKVAVVDLLPVSESAPTVTKITYKDSAYTGEPVTFGGDSDDTKVTVPANVKSDLTAAIAEFMKTADEQNGRDDARASFCCTTAEAMQKLQSLLNIGTVAGVKQAQIALSSMMNPITSNIPTSVLKFINMGGRKPTLKDLFYDKRNSTTKE